MLKQRAFKEEKIKKEAETFAKALDGKTIKIGAKAGTSGKIFGSVNAMQIADAILAQLKIEIDRKIIEVDGDLIKELGSYTAKIRFHKEVQAVINFEVIAE
jgi:large subunit ribosomal protein L9